MAGTLTVKAAQSQSIGAQIAPYVFPVECREKGCRVIITSQYMIAENADILSFEHNDNHGILGISVLVQQGTDIRDIIIEKIHRWFLDVHRETFSRHTAIRYVALESEVL